MRRRFGQRRDERGSAAVELLLMAFAWVAFLVLVVVADRYVDAQAQANDAAYAAARAASLTSDAASAVTAGQEAADESLLERGKSCQNLTVAFAGSDFTPGGQVVAEVSCTVNLIDTGAVGSQLGLEPTKAFTGRAVVPIENYRVR